MFRRRIPRLGALLKQLVMAARAKKECHFSLYSSQTQEGEEKRKEEINLAWSGDKIKSHTLHASITVIKDNNKFIFYSTATTLASCLQC